MTAAGCDQALVSIWGEIEKQLTADRLAEAQKEMAAQKEIAYARLLEKAAKAEADKDWRGGRQAQRGLRLKPKAADLAERLAYDRGLGQMAQADYSGAVTSFQETLNLKTDYKDVRVRLAQAQNEVVYAWLLEDAAKAETNEDWRTAADKLSEALTLKPGVTGLAERLAYDRGLGQMAQAVTEFPKTGSASSDKTRPSGSRAKSCGLYCVRTRSR